MTSHASWCCSLTHDDDPFWCCCGASEREPQILVSRADWDLIQAELAKPPRAVPALVDLFKRYPHSAKPTTDKTST